MQALRCKRIECSGPSSLPASGERQQKALGRLVVGPMVTPVTRLWLGFIVLIAALLPLATSCLALDTIRLGKAVPHSFAFRAAEVGVDAQIFARGGLAVVLSSLPRPPPFP